MGPTSKGGEGREREEGKAVEGREGRGRKEGRGNEPPLRNPGSAPVLGMWPIMKKSAKCDT